MSMQAAGPLIVQQLLQTPEVSARLQKTLPKTLMRRHERSRFEECNAIDGRHQRPAGIDARQIDGVHRRTCVRWLSNASLWRKQSCESITAIPSNSRASKPAVCWPLPPVSTRE